MTIIEALEAINKAYSLNFSDVVDELIDAARCWKNGSTDGILVYDEEDDKVKVVQEGKSTMTPSFVYIFDLSGNDAQDVDKEELYHELIETDFEEPFIRRLNLSEERAIGFRYLLKLFLFRVGTEREGHPYTNWKNWSQLDYDADMIEQWGIGHLENPEREITKDDLDSVYVIWESNRESKEEQKRLEEEEE